MGTAVVVAGGAVSSAHNMMQEVEKCSIQFIQLSRHGHQKGDMRKMNCDAMRGPSLPCWALVQGFGVFDQVSQLYHFIYYGIEICKNGESRVERGECDEEQ